MSAQSPTQAGQSISRGGITSLDSVLPPSLISELNMQPGNECLSWAAPNAFPALAVLAKLTQKGPAAPDAVTARAGPAAVTRADGSTLQDVRNWVG